jgi:hypothetical protein
LVFVFVGSLGLFFFFRFLLDFPLAVFFFAARRLGVRDPEHVEGRRSLQRPCLGRRAGAGLSVPVGDETFDEAVYDGDLSTQILAYEPTTKNEQSSDKGVEGSLPHEDHPYDYPNNYAHSFRITHQLVLRTYQP